MEIGPGVLCHQGAIKPFGQRRQAFDRFADDPRQRFPGDPGGHRIDRLNQGERGEIGFFDDVVGMDHGRATIEGFNPAADVTPLADRQRLFQPDVVGVKEGQGDFAGVVMAIDPIGHATVAARRLLMTVDPDQEGDDRSLRGERYSWLVAAVDQCDRQMKQEVDDARRIARVGATDQPAQRDCELRSDPVEAGDRAEERIKDFRPHDVLLPDMEIADGVNRVDWHAVGDVLPPDNSVRDLYIRTGATCRKWHGAGFLLWKAHEC